MITRDELHALLRNQSATDTHVLTVYLNIDQSVASNINRGFERTLKTLLQEVRQSVAEEDAEEFEANVKAVREFVQSYSPQGKTLVIFSNRRDEVFVHRNLCVGLESEANWSRRPFMRPAMEVRDEFERYALVLADRQHARILVVSLGEIEDREELESSEDVHRFDASGKDKMWSQMVFQRRADEHAHHHLKSVAEQLDKLEGRREFSRIVLAGPTEPVHELERQLSERMRPRVVGHAHLDFDAPEAKLVEQCEHLIEQAERKEERQIVDDLVTAAAKNDRGVLGLEDTVAACVQGRISSLVYTETLEVSDEQVERIMDKHGDAIHSPSNPITNGGPGRDFLEWLVESVMREGGEVEHVKQDAAERLEKEGAGVGALCRF